MEIINSILKAFTCVILGILFVVAFKYPQYSVAKKHDLTHGLSLTEWIILEPTINIPMKDVMKFNFQDYNTKEIK